MSRNIFRAGSCLLPKCSMRMDIARFPKVALLWKALVGPKSRGRIQVTMARMKKVRTTAVCCPRKDHCIHCILECVFSQVRVLFAIQLLALCHPPHCLAQLSQIFSSKLASTSYNTETWELDIAKESVSFYAVQSQCVCQRFLIPEPPT